jgi:hypothetical protein
MSLMRILKENHVLLAGIILPLLLVALLAFAKAFPFHVVPDPSFRMVYAINNYAGGGRFTYKVTDDGKLDVAFVYSKAEQQNGGYPRGVERARVFIFTPATGALEDTPLNAPDLKEGEEKVSLPLEKFSAIKLSGQITAPDGYRYEDRGYSRSSFLTDVLSFHGSHGPMRVIVKDSRAIPLPNPTNIYGETIFIGWIIEEQK